MKKMMKREGVVHVLLVSSGDGGDEYAKVIV